MRVVKKADREIPFIDISVPAGFPSPAADHMEEAINLNDFLIQHPVSTFLVKCSGLSMIDAFIPPVAHLLVDRSREAANGSIVLAWVNGGFTVKYLQKNGKRCRLLPANKKHHPIEITESSGLIIWGVVTKIISDPNDYKNGCFG